MSRFVLLLCCVALTAQSARAEITILGECDSDYESCLADWKQRRVEFLKSEDGYLNLVGLFWLKTGESSFGSSDVNDVVFPLPADAEIGSFALQDGLVTMTVREDADVRFEDRRVAQMSMPDDTTGAPVTVSHGDLSWTIINRAGKFAVRLRHPQKPGIAAFGPIEYFPVNSNMRVTARFHAYDEARVVNVGTVVDGLSYKPRAPGTVTFELDGKAYELEAYEARGELFFVFGDLSNRDETYPAGRFLYADPADEDGNVILDFNIAQNPPCAFNEYSTCPVPSSRNRLKTRITAGERYDRSVD